VLKILFFASLRERLGTDKTTMNADRASTVGEVRQALIEDHPEWSDTLSQSRLMIAINQNMAREDAPVTDEDEIAFFPPVTGG